VTAHVRLLASSVAGCCCTLLVYVAVIYHCVMYFSLQTAPSQIAQYDSM
jgi:hypothetical protein